MVPSRHGDTRPVSTQSRRGGVNSDLGNKLNELVIRLAEGNGGESGYPKYLFPACMFDARRLW
jgi:hypothetical protein